MYSTVVASFSALDDVSTANENWSLYRDGLGVECFKTSALDSKTIPTAITPSI